jgi:hypothetical protein
MTTISEAIEVMGVVAACHHRTAPRMDDREAVMVTAKIWADLFNVHNLGLADLKAAVMKRAAGGAADAPEPAEIITVARAIRMDRTQRWDDDDQADHEAFLEAKAAGRVNGPEEWVALKSANKHRLAELINPVAARKGIKPTGGTA